MLGYFSVIGLLRVHVLLGDFTLALKVMDDVDISQKVTINLLISKTFRLTHSTVSVHSDNSLCCDYILLCWVLLPCTTSLRGRYSHVCLDSQPHLAYKAVPYAQLPIRPTQQNRRSDVRFTCHLPRSFPQSTGRQHREYCKGALWRPARKDVARVRALSCLVFPDL